MKFLDAAAIVRSFEGGDPLEFLLAMSGQPEPLEVFLRAAAAEEGYSAQPRTLPFNTLAQQLLTQPRTDEREVFLLFPWDFVPEADWRSGGPSRPQAPEQLIVAARETASRLERRPHARVIYCDAPLPAIATNHREGDALRDRLRALAVSIGGTILGEDHFSLTSLFEHGSPLAPTGLGTVARTVIGAATAEDAPLAKVLVTDFDNTLWRGVVGEDGVSALSFAPQGLGFPHFVYQRFLHRLKHIGILLAGVTKNDADLALAPLESPDSVLRPEDFVSVVASYGAKSAQIKGLAEALNLGLDSFVFVDDNPVELAEVEEALPDVRTVRFPESANQLSGLLWELSRIFHRERVTDEDRDRTDMYRTRLAGMPPSRAAGSDLSTFLAGLEMVLSIRDRTTGDRTRAVQLINKTNQFNLNGVRRSDEEVADILAAGGRLYTASLSDRHGAHGEILACLIDPNGTVRSLVMSCRVFQRRVEHAFWTWVARHLPATTRLEFIRTERNEPLRLFLDDPSFGAEEGRWYCNMSAFTERHEESLALFTIEDPGTGGVD